MLEVVPLNVRVLEPCLVMPPVPVMLPLNVTALAVVRMRVELPRLASALKVNAPEFDPSPRVTFPPMVTAFRIERAVPLPEESVPPFRVRPPVPIALLVIAPTEPTLATPICRVPAVRVVPPL